MKGMICLLRFKIVFNFDGVYTVSSCTRACQLTNGHPLYIPIYIVCTCMYYLRFATVLHTYIHRPPFLFLLLSFFFKKE